MLWETMVVVPYLLMSLPIALLCHILAKEKGRDEGAKWVILGLVPVVNYFVLVYLLGGKDRQQEAKLDQILERLQQLERRA